MDNSVREGDTWLQLRSQFRYTRDIRFLVELLMDGLNGMQTDYKTNPRQKYPSGYVGQTIEI